jgi:tellurite resistance protein TerC
MVQHIPLFPMVEYWWLYLVFVGIVLFLLILDLGVFHKESHAVGFKEAAVWSVVWVSLALLFNVGLYYYASINFPENARLMAIPGFDPASAAKQVGLEFLTGYVIEKALAVDNIFVFIVVFSYFSIPAKYQHRVLFYGILGALVFRAIFISIGSVLMQYEWIVIIFGVFLIITGIKMFWAGDSAPDPEKNPIVRLTRKFLPVTPTLHGDKFFVRTNGVLHATPLFLALLFLEFSDIIFAVDSVPAIFAITKEPFIVFTSNMFAILGLRAMYFLLADIMHRFWLLKYGLAFILIFVGLKMVWLNEAFGGKFPISYSLSIIGAILVVSIVASLIFKQKDGPTESLPKTKQ